MSQSLLTQGLRHLPPRLTLYVRQKKTINPKMSATEELDVHEPYQAHAFFALGFTCEKCKVSLPGSSDDVECSDLWCRNIAKDAESKGWVVPPPTADGSMDVMTTWCPACARQLGKKKYQK